MAKALSPSQLDKAEAEARLRFEKKKAEGVEIEKRIAKDQAELETVTQELARIQGEFRAIQNLRSAGGAGTLPAKPKKK